MHLNESWKRIESNRFYLATKSNSKKLQRPLPGFSILIMTCGFDVDYVWGFVDSRFYLHKYYALGSTTDVFFDQLFLENVWIWIYFLFAHSQIRYRPYILFKVIKLYVEIFILNSINGCSENVLRLRVLQHVLL